MIVNRMQAYTVAESPQPPPFDGPMAQMGHDAVTRLNIAFREYSDGVLAAAAKRDSEWAYSSDAQDKWKAVISEIVVLRELLR